MSARCSELSSRPALPETSDRPGLKLPRFTTDQATLLAVVILSPLVSDVLAIVIARCAISALPVFERAAKSKPKTAQLPRSR